MFRIFNKFYRSFFIKCLKFVFKVVPEVACYFVGYREASFVGIESRLKLSALSNNFEVDLKGVLLDPTVQYFNESENKESFYKFIRVRAPAFNQFEYNVSDSIRQMLDWCIII